MQPIVQEQGTISILDDYLEVWIVAFLKDRKAQNMSRGTIDFYRKKLALFVNDAEGQAISRIFQITPDSIRNFLLDLEAKGHNRGGISCCYRGLKTFLLWWKDETEPEGWKNPIRKVHSPKLNKEILEPVSLEDVRRMIGTCKNDLLGKRDKAMFLTLLSSGVRASELIAITRNDVNPIMGEVMIRHAKGGKDRTVYISNETRRAVRAYLRLRHDSNPYIWITDDGEHLTYWGLKMMVRRRANVAGVKVPQVHAFRRFFALACLRANMPIYSLKDLMGHSDIQVLERYLKIVENDVREAYMKHNPLDSTE